MQTTRGSKWHNYSTDEVFSKLSPGEAPRKHRQDRGEEAKWSPWRRNFGQQLEQHQGSQRFRFSHWAMINEMPNRQMQMASKALGQLEASVAYPASDQPPDLREIWGIVFRKISASLAL
ncbi:hypothetical protein MKZ38_000876 [Zalerion maritima]|uniref:Uncharacterized protein n=1 Tax=Zalerion maritima TaxID=339359 RepID=A0AAD5WV34_9PEZI|nr:hypothetical protein MKZ38_000876 [Zalerion maritima]